MEKVKEGEQTISEDIPTSTKKKEDIYIEKVENGFVVRGDFRTKFVAVNLEEAITLVRNYFE